ncbi:hypothetical protein [Mesorhizobium sp. M7A.F.Ca.ET.027.03.2.1]|uniref:hypothetical protein n=1 Tax=Mesorhizobium sp. M7A.F.Ca.ET.027.03.2.1 TaxID=2496656 RepID=UPI0016787DE3|nr:hypothetical protein [Mesorhizobium sp. M7A.F.Ca.ET.027.03.2.1]
MIWLLPILATALIWLWLWFRRDPELDFDDIRDVEIAVTGTLLIWSAFALFCFIWWVRA